MEPTKSILVVSPQNMARSEEFFRGMDMTEITGSRYLGVFIGNREAEATWLDKKLQGWAELVRTLLGVDHKHPQSAYAGLQNSLQQEWSFLKQVPPDIGDTFGPVEEVLRDTFIPVLSKGVGEGTPVWGVACLPVKQAGLALLDPTKASPENWVESCVKTGNLVAALRVQGDFRTEDHAAYLKEGRE